MAGIYDTLGFGPGQFLQGLNRAKAAATGQPDPGMPDGGVPPELLAMLEKINGGGQQAPGMSPLPFNPMQGGIDPMGQIMRPPQQGPQQPTSDVPAPPTGLEPSQPPQAPAGPQNPPGGGMPAQSGPPPGRVVKRAAGTTSLSSNPATMPMDQVDADTKQGKSVGKDYFGRSRELEAGLEQQMNAPQDYSGYERIAKQRGEQGGNNLVLALLMQQVRGQEEGGNRLLQRALAAQGPQEFDEGTVDTTGKFVEKPGLALNRKLRVQEFMLTNEEKRAMRQMSADEKMATLAAAEQRWKAEMDQRNLHQKQQLAATYAGQSGKDWHTVEDAAGNKSLVNVKTGERMGAPEGAAQGGGYALGKNASAKDRESWSEAHQGLDAYNKLQSEMAGLSKKDRDSLGAVAGVVNTQLSGFMGGAGPRVPDNRPESVKKLEVRTAERMALIVNQLYGAAVSRGEGQRALPFLIQQGDSYADRVRKMEAMKAIAMDTVGSLSRAYNQQSPYLKQGPQGKSASDYLQEQK